MSYSQLSVYAAFRSIGAKIGESYLGTAVNGNRPTSIWDRPLEDGIHHGIIMAGYVVPFIVMTVATLSLLVIAIVVVLVPQQQLQLELGNNITCYRSLKNLMKYLVIVIRAKAADFQRKAIVDVTLQANLVATTILCLYITGYVLVLDGYSLASENKLIAPLPIYFVAKQQLYLITFVCCLVSFAVYLFGIIVFLVSYYCCCCHGRLMGMTIGMICCIGSAFISLS